MSFEYEYVTGLQLGERQYDRDYNFDENKIVNARYIKTAGYEGNPYIEALPRGYSYMEIQYAYNKPVTVPTVDELQAMDEYEQEDSVDILDNFRVSLPFHTLLEKQFHQALISSYKRRKIIEDSDYDVHLTIKGKDVVTHNKLVPKNMSDPAIGFTLLGTSGCGKSTGINMLLSHYPQTIFHNWDSWQRRVQIVYLLVHCTPNSNFQKLYENIGEAIDNALGNYDDTYKVQFKKGTLGDKYDLLKQLVSKFAIGVIILDEIELMDLKSNKESSFEALLALTNESGVAICIVGTMDAYAKLFNKARTARRTGVAIIANRYCYAKNIFKRIVICLQINQWGRQKVDYANDEQLLDALYRATHGVISDLIQIYKMIQKEQLKYVPCINDSEEVKQKKMVATPPEITADYILKTGQKYFEILNKARAVEDSSFDDQTAALSIAELERMNTAQDRIDEEKANQRYMDSNNTKTVLEYIQMQQNVVRILELTCPEYSKGKIERAFTTVMRRPEMNTDIPVDEIVKYVKRYLDSKSKVQGKKADVGADKLANLRKLQQELLNNQETSDAEDSTSHKAN